MAEQVSQRADFLYREFVDTNVKQMVEADLLWEKLLVTQGINALNVRYYRETYVDIETPNDTAMSANVDTFLRSPGYRAPGGDFPHTTFAEPSEYNLGLYQMALEMDIPDEAQKYVELENTMLKGQKKLANAFSSKVNTILGNKLTDNWSPSNISAITLSSGQEWNTDPTASTVQPITSVLTAMETIEDISGYNYKPSGLLVPKQSYFDLRNWMAVKNYQYKEVMIGPETKVISIEGLPVHVSNQVTRDKAVMGDFQAAGVLYEAEPMNTRQYYTDKDRTTHIQLSRTFNYALTDPKAICLIVNTVA